MVIALFILGLFVGSFLNTVVLRSEKRQSIVNPPSHCPKCGKKIKLIDLIPVLSFLFLKGKCRYCREKISYFYPFGEILTGLVFALLGWHLSKLSSLTLVLHASKNGFLLGAVFLISFLFYFSVLIILSLFDLRNYLIHSKLLLTGFGGALVANLIFYFNKVFLNFSFLGGYFIWLPFSNFWLNKLAGALVAGGLFFLLWFFSRGRAIGFGDWQVGAFIGFVFGLTDTLMIVFISFLLGTLLALVLIPLKKLKFKSRIPYAPFISLAALITILFGEQLLTWYLRLFGII